MINQHIQILRKEHEEVEKKGTKLSKDIFHGHTKLYRRTERKIPKTTSFLIPETCFGLQSCNHASFPASEFPLLTLPRVQIK